MEATLCENLKRLVELSLLIIFLLAISILKQVAPQSRCPKELEPFTDHDQGHNYSYNSTRIQTFV